MLNRDQGYEPLVLDKVSYTTGGAAVPFRKTILNEGGSSHQSQQHSAFLTLKCYSGTALISFTGEDAAPFLELATGDILSMAIRAPALYIKGSGAAAEVGGVVGLNPADV